MANRDRKARLLHRASRPCHHLQPLRPRYRHRLRQYLSLQRHLPPPMRRQVLPSDPRPRLRRPALRTLRNEPQMPRLARNKQPRARCRET